MGVAEVSLVRRPAVFLDRDGVLNHAQVIDGTPHPPSSLSDLHVISSAAEACRALRAAGYALVVVTNQPDIARGIATIAGVDVLNKAVAAEVPIDEFVICPHDDVDGCTCRKPLPGMLLKAAARLGLDLEHSFMVGDRWRDVEAGRNAGCTTVFVDRGYTERKPDDPDVIVVELIEAVPQMLAALTKLEEGTQIHA